MASRWRRHQARLPTAGPWLLKAARLYIAAACTGCTDGPRPQPLLLHLLRPGTGPLDYRPLAPFRERGASLRRSWSAPWPACLFAQEQVTTAHPNTRHAAGCPCSSGCVGSPQHSSGRMPGLVCLLVRVHGHRHCWPVRLRPAGVCAWMTGYELVARCRSTVLGQACPRAPAAAELHLKALTSIKVAPEAASLQPGPPSRLEKKRLHRRKSP